MSQFVTTQEVARMLSVTRSTLYLYRKQGMPHVMLTPRTVRYDLAAVERWLNQPRKTN